MKKHIHFIGIGGIGVSALAKYYLKKGWLVSGSDLAATEITQQMKDLGAQVHIGKPKASLITAKTQKVIFSPAVQKDHPERAAARKSKIPELSYPQALGELTKQHYTIAVSGTHGKSTTAAMLGLLLTKAGLDPTVIVGTKLKEFGDSTHSTGSGLTSSSLSLRAEGLSNVEGSNCRVGKSKYLVIEADEHFASFLNYRPQIIVLTSLEADHLDFYKTLANLKKTFKKYVSLVPKDGWIVANKDDKNIQETVRGLQNVLWYFLLQKEAKVLSKKMKLPGKHNTANALAALTVAKILGIPDAKSIAALLAYQGSWRRFEIFQVTINNKQLTLVSDYGHHPTEIRVTMEAAREKWPKKEMWLIYQPHQYQRTFYLFKDFVRVLSKLPIEKLIVTDIYDVAGREEGRIKEKVSSAKLLKAIQATSYPSIPSSGSRDKLQATALHIPSIEETQRYLEKHLKGGEVVIIMGAGDIYALTLRLRSG